MASTQTIWNLSYKDLDPSLLGIQTVEFLISMDAIWENLRLMCANLVTKEELSRLSQEYDSDLLHDFITYQINYLKSIKCILKGFLISAEKAASLLRSFKGSDEPSGFDQKVKSLLNLSRVANDGMLILRFKFDEKKLPARIERSSESMAAFEQTLKDARAASKDASHRLDDLRINAEKFIKEIDAKKGEI